MSKSEANETGKERKMFTEINFIVSTPGQMQQQRFM